MILPFRLVFLSMLVSLCCLLAGCGGGGGSPAPTITVTVTPDTAQLIPAQTTTFSATVTGTNRQAVIWSVQEGVSGGTITANGAYTAPALAGTYHVIAVSEVDQSKNDVATVQVRISLAVQPSTATLTLRETKQFSATVIGSTNQNVVWSVQEGSSGGVITATGFYTAPATPGIYHIVATSQVAPQQSISVPITVLAGSASGTVE